MKDDAYVTWSLVEDAGNVRIPQPIDEPERKDIPVIFFQAVDFLENKAEFGPGFDDSVLPTVVGQNDFSMRRRAEPPFRYNRR